MLIHFRCLFLRRFPCPSKSTCVHTLSAYSPSQPQKLACRTPKYNPFLHINLLCLSVYRIFIRKPLPTCSTLWEDLILHSTTLFVIRNSQNIKPTINPCSEIGLGGFEYGRSLLSYHSFILTFRLGTVLEDCSAVRAIDSKHIVHHVEFHVHQFDSASSPPAWRSH